MLKFICATAFMVASVFSIAQKPPIKFGDISIEDLKMSRYNKDSAASAVVLADYGESALKYDQEAGFVLQFERITRIKILTKDGFEYGNFSIPLYHDGKNDEKIVGLKAVTYNLENGKIVESKVKSDATFKEKYDNNLDFIKVPLSNVKEGSIVEITYVIKSDFVFNFQDWEFQSMIPTVWSEYRAKVPEYFYYDKYMQGYIPLAISEETKGQGSINIVNKERSEGYITMTSFSNDKFDYQENRFRWVAKDVPAFKPEPFITSTRDYISKINFELSYTKFPNQAMKTYMGSWEDINNKYIESSEFYGEVTSNAFLKKTVDEITSGMSGSEEKMIAIGNYVKQNISWDGSKRKFTAQSIKKVMEEKKGNSAEVNLLLASMLHKADINVLPVLLSTRDHGYVREETPISSQFNYVISMATIGDKTFLLDATEKLLPIGMLPERCLNGKGFAVSKTGYQWIPLQTTTKSRTVVNADLQFTNEAELKGKLQIDRSGYDGLAARKKYFTKDEVAYIKDFVGSRSWQISKSEIVNSKDIHQPLKETYELVMTEQATVAGDIIYLNPLLLYKIEENPFKLEEREYPVDFSSPFERIYICRILIPDGYQIDELPQAKALALPANAAKYTFSVSQVGNQLNISSNLQINKSVFVPQEYPQLREFYNKVIAKQAEQIVFKKK